MSEDINKKKALFKRLSDELSRRSREDGFPQDKLKKLLELKDQTAKAIGREMREEQAKPYVVKNYTDKLRTNEVVDRVPNVTETIDTKSITKKLPNATDYLPDDKMVSKTGSEFTESLTKKLVKHRAASKLAKAAGKFAKSGMKSIPLIGGIAAAISSGDASAAVPVLGDVESLGPKEGSEEAKLEDMSLPMEERIKLLKSIKERKDQ